jgi:hypothetical protein
MYPYMNEDVAFERLKDLQREVENSRMAAGSLAGLGASVRNLLARAWWLGGLAMRRAPRRRPGQEQRRRPAPSQAQGLTNYEETSASEVA